MCQSVEEERAAAEGARTKAEQEARAREEEKKSSDFVATRRIRSIRLRERRKRVERRTRRRVVPGLGSRR